MTIKALTKPSFTAPAAVDHLPDQLITPEHSSLAQHVIAGYRALRTEAVKTYDAMLKPLNTKRGVILGWKRDDLSDIDRVIEIDVQVVRLQTRKAAIERFHDRFFVVTSPGYGF